MDIKYKSHKTLMLLLLTSIILFNCSNDDTTTNESQQLNFRVASFTTSLSTYGITYNQNNLIESIEFPTIDGIRTDQVTYDSNDKITAIGTINYTYNDTNEIISITSENTNASLDYNEQGEIVSINTTRVNDDSSISESLASFVYNSDGMVDYTIESNSDNPTLTYRTRFTYDANLNIAQIFQEETTDGVNFNLTRTQTYTHDNKKAPYYEINNILNDNSKTSVFNFWNFYNLKVTRRSFQPVWHYSPNNFLTINKVTISTGATTLFDFENSYNNEDYLTLMDRTVTSPTGVESFAIFGFNYETY